MKQDLLYIFSALLASELLLVTYFDLAYRLIPNWLNAIIFFSGLVAVRIGSLHEVFLAMVGAMIVFGLGWGFKNLYHKQRQIPGLGGGDVKLVAASVPWVGMLGIPSVVLIASAVALMVVALAFLLGRSITAQTAIPFGPFLAISIYWVWCNGPLTIPLPI